MVFKGYTLVFIAYKWRPFSYIEVYHSVDMITNEYC